jgi:hypothetical protein
MFKKVLVVLTGAVIASQSMIAFADIGEYAEIKCDSPEFAQNNCNQCFDGGKVAIGEKLTNLFDTWTNANPTEEIIYKDEQSMPELINLGGDKTKWSSVPDDPTRFWKFANEIAWVNSAFSNVSSSTGTVASSGSTITGTTPSSSKQEFLLEANNKIRFLESDLGAVHTLEATDKKDGDSVGLIKYSLNYHDISADGNESSVKNHVECVSYKLSGEQAKPPVVPPTATKVKTGPGMLIIILAALGLGFGIVRLKGKKA